MVGISSFFDLPFAMIREPFSGGRPGPLLCSGGLPGPRPLPHPPLERSCLPLGCRIGSKAAKIPDGSVGGGRLSSPEENLRMKDNSGFEIQFKYRRKVSLIH